MTLPLPLIHTQGAARSTEVFTKIASMPVLAKFNGCSSSKKPAIAIGTSIERRNGMELFSEPLNEIEALTTLQRLAWGLSEVSECTGLSVAFLRAEVRAGRLPVRRFGR